MLRPIWTIKAWLKRCQRETSTLALTGPKTILAKDLVILCPCSKNLPKAKLKSNAPIPLMGTVSRQHNIESVVRLLVTIMQIYNGKKEARQKEI